MSEGNKIKLRLKWHNSSYVAKVLWACLPICGLLSWILFCLPSLQYDSVKIFGYQLIGGVVIDNVKYNFSGYKEIVGCVYLTLLGFYGLFVPNKINRGIQAGLATIGFAFFILFALWNEQILKDLGLQTAFKTGAIWPIILSLVMLVCSIILYVNSDIEKVKDN